MSIDCGAIVDGWHGDAAFTRGRRSDRAGDQAADGGGRTQSLAAAIDVMVAGRHLGDIGAAVAGRGRVGRVRRRARVTAATGSAGPCTSGPTCRTTARPGAARSCRRGSCWRSSRWSRPGIDRIEILDDGWSVVTRDGSLGGPHRAHDRRHRQRPGDPHPLMVSLVGPSVLLARLRLVAGASARRLGWAGHGAFLAYLIQRSDAVAVAVHRAADGLLAGPAEQLDLAVAGDRRDVHLEAGVEEAEPQVRVGAEQADTVGRLGAESLDEGVVGLPVRIGAVDRRADERRDGEGEGESVRLVVRLRRGGRPAVAGVAGARWTRRAGPTGPRQPASPATAPWPARARDRGGRSLSARRRASRRSSGRRPSRRGRRPSASTRRRAGGARWRR